MIRERVSTNGITRPLEPEEKLSALQFPEELMGVMSELVLRRYYDGRAKFSKKFGKVSKKIEKQRRRHLERAHNDTMRNMAQLQNYLSQDKEKEKAEKAGDNTRTSGRTPKGIQEDLISAGSWPWAWALDLDESPPPSSIVARRDTEEALRLARIADQAFLMDENVMSGNNLWSLLVDFLTKTPGKHKHEHKRKDGHGREGHADVFEETDGNIEQEKHRSRFARFVTEHRKGHGPSESSNKE